MMRVWLPILVLLLGAVPAFGQEEAPADEALATAEGVVRELYGLVTFEAGQTPDWERVKALFLDEAIVVLRTSRTALSVFSREAFVADFVHFIETYNVADTGFEERIVRLSTVGLGDIAHVLVLYEAHIPGAARPPQQGVDSFQLIRRDERWWIVSITNEIPRPDRPIPDVLQH